MSRRVADSSVPAANPEKPATAAPVLSAQQRIWVREIAETLKRRRQESRLRRHLKQGATFGDQSTPGTGGEIQ